MARQGPFINSNTRGPFISAGSELMEWTQLMATTEGSSPSDPSSMGKDGTSFTDGLFRIVYSNNATLLDGYRENLLRWTYPLTTLVPDFNPAIHILELACDFRAAHGGQLGTPAADTANGIFIGLGDRGTGDLANLNAAIGGFYVSGASAERSAILSTTSMTSEAISTSLIDSMKAEIGFASLNGASWRPSLHMWHYLTSANSYNIQDIATDQAAFSTTVANWTIQVGAWRETATSAEDLDYRFAVFYRVTERSSNFFPPV